MSPPSKSNQTVRYPSQHNTARRRFREERGEDPDGTDDEAYYRDPGVTKFFGQWGEQGEIICECNELGVSYEVKKDGPNHGRYFTTCPHWSDKAKKCRLYLFQDLEDGAIPSIGNPIRPLPDGAMPPSPSQKRRELENAELIRAVEAAENRAMLATPQKNAAPKRYSPDWEDPSDHDNAKSKRAYLITPTSNKSNKRQKRVIESSDSENEIQILEIPVASTSQSRHDHPVGVNVKRSSTPTPSFSLPLSPPPPPASIILMNTPPLLAKKEKVEKKYDTSLEKRVKELEKKLSVTEKKLSATEDEVVALREDKVHLMKVIANLKS